MPNKFRINALSVIALAILFYLFFMASKHNPSLSVVNAFAEDPYDAVGSFGVQAATFLSILSLIRSFRRYHVSTPLEEPKILLARTQVLAVLAVVVTLASDSVAMLRYPSLWIRLPNGYELAALLSSLVLLTVLAGLPVYRSLREIRLQTMPNSWKKALLVSFVSVLMLAFYPEYLRESTPGALSTVILGALLLFAPMWAWGMTLVPYQVEEEQQIPSTRFGWLREYKYQVVLVIFLGVLMGLFLVLGESTEGGGAPHLTGFALVALIYVSLETTALMIGYGFLRKPLGLFR